MPENDLSDVIKLVSDIKHEKLIRSHDMALSTEELLENLISEGNWKNAIQLMNLIKQRMAYINENLPQAATVLNIMRHILKLIREEYQSAANKGREEHSLHQMVAASDDTGLEYNEQFPALKTSLLDHLTEYKVELESSVDNIAAQAIEHIHSGEFILTVGKSNTVERFLKSASKSKDREDFQVIVVESSPKYEGHTLAANLAKSNIKTIIIPDSAVFAMMSRVNKVIIGTHTVLANGGLRTTSGIHAIALAAKHYSVPVIVLAHMYKFTPVHYGAHRDTFNICASPAEIIPSKTGQLLNKVNLYNPLFDYVPPELVTLFITHQGGNACSYVYRLLSELYHLEDYDI